MNRRHVLDEALDKAVEARLVKVFDVFATNPTEAASLQFKKDVQNIEDAYDKAITLLDL